MPFQINQAWKHNAVAMLAEEGHLSTALYEIVDNVQFAKEDRLCVRLFVSPARRVHIKFSFVLHSLIQRKCSGMANGALEFTGGAIKVCLLQVLTPCRPVLVTEFSTH
jgi:hypothetical protein